MLSHWDASTFWISLKLFILSCLCAGPLFRDAHAFFVPEKSVWWNRYIIIRKGDARKWGVSFCLERFLLTPRSSSLVRNDSAVISIRSDSGVRNLWQLIVLSYEWIVGCAVMGTPFHFQRLPVKKECHCIQRTQWQSFPFPRLAENNGLFSVNLMQFSLWWYQGGSIVTDGPLFLFPVFHTYFKFLHSHI